MVECRMEKKAAEGEKKKKGEAETGMKKTDELVFN